MKSQKKATHGGARKGAGRKKRPGWRQQSIAIREPAWEGVKRLALRRRKRGEKNVSASQVAGELVETALVYFGLEDGKRAALEGIAPERGCTLDEIIQEAVAEFLKE